MRRCEREAGASQGIAARVMVAPYLIHIGYHKTGTTWLQRHYFSRREAGFALLREPGHLIYEQPLFHYDPPAARRAVDELFAADVKAGLKPVISCEQLSGNAASGGWHAKEYAWRLASGFPDARLLMVVREQRTMIRSSYLHYLRRGGGMSLRDFMVAPQDPRVPQADLYYFRYDGLLRHYLELFPREQVLCLPYELFRDRPAEFIAALDAFTGAALPGQTLPVGRRENAREGMLQYPVRRVINPLIIRNSVNGRSPYAMTFFQFRTKQALNFLARQAPKAWDRALVRRWERQIEETTAGFYEASNRVLAEMIGIDLGPLGWRV